MPGLGTSFGRGAATSFQEDLQNSDCILIMGSNMAEAHPVGFRFPMKARERGATLIHVDPHFSRTSAMCRAVRADPAGSDIVFLGGLINYVLTNERWFREYVLAFTNAATIVDEEYRDAEDLDGLFSGFDARAAPLRSEAQRLELRRRAGRRGAETQHTAARSKRNPAANALGRLAEHASRRSRPDAAASATA